MAEDKYNRKNPAVKRILQEVKEMQSNPSDDFVSLPLEENIFEWQFAIRGPRDSEFEGGIYHGRIQLPADYPFKPPSFMLLTVLVIFISSSLVASNVLLQGTTSLCISSNFFNLFQPNGRFETQTKICLSISNHHPEHWQPSWSVRTALVALIAFMPTSPNGALGSLDYPKEERRTLAIKSRESSPKFGSPERQKLIDEIHERMLSKAQPVSHSNKDSEVHTDSKEIQQIPQDIVEETTENLSLPPVENEIVEEQNETPSDANAAQTSNPVAAVPTTSQQLLYKPESRVPKPADDRLFTLAALGLTLAIVVLVLKKFLKANGHGAVFMDES